MYNTYTCIVQVLLSNQLLEYLECLEADHGDREEGGGGGVVRLGLLPQPVVDTCTRSTTVYITLHFTIDPNIL